MRGLKIMLAVIFVVAFASIAMAQTTVTINGGSSFSCNGGYLTLSNIQVDDGVITVNVICNAGNVTPTPTPTPGPTPTPTPTPTPPPSGGGYQGTYLAMNSNPTFDNLGGGQTRLYYFTLPANCGGNGQLRIATNQQQSAPHAAVVVKKTNGSTSTPP
ncbi:MAG TPA: hypothetical protein VEI96_00745, partial [Thermodesulfovibrionales bacterium]|nr:hypothetical protein [Thermodesulfovibrionales bacterium]